MPLFPDFDGFRAGFEAGRNQVVWTRLAADLDTPVSLMLKLAGAARHSFVLESVTGGEVRGRYSIVGMNPDLVWDCRGREAASTAPPATTTRPSRTSRAPPSTRCGRSWRNAESTCPRGSPPPRPAFSAISATT